MLQIHVRKLFKLPSLPSLADLRLRSGSFPSHNRARAFYVYCTTLPVLPKALSVLFFTHTVTNSPFTRYDDFHPEQHQTQQQQQQQTAANASAIDELVRRDLPSQSRRHNGYARNLISNVTFNPQDFNIAPPSPFMDRQEGDGDDDEGEDDDHGEGDQQVRIS